MRRSTRQRKKRCVVRRCNEWCTRRQADRLLSQAYGLDSIEIRDLYRWCAFASRSHFVYATSGQRVAQVRALGRKILFYSRADFKDASLISAYRHAGIDIRCAARYIGTTLRTLKAACAVGLLQPVLTNIGGSDASIAPVALDEFRLKYTHRDLEGLRPGMPAVHQYVMRRFSHNAFNDFSLEEVNALDRSGRTALHRAVVCSQSASVPDIVVGLLLAGCNPFALDANGCTARDVLVNRMSMSKSIDTDLAFAAAALDRWGGTARKIDEPINVGDSAHLVTLLVALDDVQSVVQILRGNHPFDVSSFFYDARSSTMVDVLIGIAGDDIHTVTYCGTPASYAASMGRFDVERRLIEHGADARSFDMEMPGGTPLSDAAERNDVRTCLALLERGADPWKARNVAPVVRDNEAWSVIKCWESDLLAEVASDSGVVVGPEVRERARL